MNGEELRAMLHRAHVEDRRAGRLKILCQQLGARDYDRVERQFRSDGGPQDVLAWLRGALARWPLWFAHDATRHLAEIRPMATAQRSAPRTVTQMSEAEYRAECRRRGLRPPGGG